MVLVSAVQCPNDLSHVAASAIRTSDKPCVDDPNRSGTKQDMARVTRKKTQPTLELDEDGETNGDEDGPEQEMQPLVSSRRNKTKPAMLENGKEPTTKTAVVRVRMELRDERKKKTREETNTKGD